MQHCYENYEKFFEIEIIWQISCSFLTDFDRFHLSFQLCTKMYTIIPNFNRFYSIIIHSLYNSCNRFLHCYTCFHDCFFQNVYFSFCTFVHSAMYMCISSQCRGNAWGTSEYKFLECFEFLICTRSKSVMYKMKSSYINGYTTLYT